MSGYIGKTTNLDRDVVGRQAQSEREEMWGAVPAEVVDYDHKTMTITARPLMKPVYNGKKVDMPDLYEVPLDVPRTGNSAITNPIPKGTRVVLYPAMRSMENYDEKDDGTPSDGRSFHISDMRASISGGESLSKPLANVDPNNTHIRFDGEGKFGIRGSPDGKFMIEGKEGNLYDIIATFMELVASDQLQIAYGSSAGTGHALQNRAQLMELAGKVRAMAL